MTKCTNHRAGSLLKINSQRGAKYRRVFLLDIVQVHTYIVKLHTLPSWPGQEGMGCEAPKNGPNTLVFSDVNNGNFFISLDIFSILYALPVDTVCCWAVSCHTVDIAPGNKPSHPSLSGDSSGRVGPSCH